MLATAGGREIARRLGVREHTVLRAGPRGAALAALAMLGDSQATLFTDSSRPHNSLIGCRQICQFRGSEPSLNECRC